MTNASNRPTPVTGTRPIRTLLVTSFSDGVPVNIVQKVMGHEQASTTLNRYTHTPDDYSARVRAAFSDPAASTLPMEDEPDQADGTEADEKHP